MMREKRPYQPTPGSGLPDGFCLQNGKYRITSSKFSGRFGIIYKAKNTFNDKEVCIIEFFIPDLCKRCNTGEVIWNNFNPGFTRKLKNNFLTESNLIHILGTQTKIQTYEVFEENQTAYYAVEFTGELIFEEKSTSSNEPQTPRNNTKRMNTTFEKLFSPKSRFSLKHGRKEAVDPTDPYLADDFEDYDPEDFILEEEDIKERLPMFCYCILNIFLGMELYTQWGFLQHITGHVKAVSLTICFAVCLLCLLWEKEYPKTRIILLIPYLIMPFSIYLINHFLLINFETINYGTLFLINLLATLPGYMIRYAMRKIKRLIRFI